MGNFQKLQKKNLWGTTPAGGMAAGGAMSGGSGVAPVPAQVANQGAAAGSGGARPGPGVAPKPLPLPPKADAKPMNSTDRIRQQKADREKQAVAPGVKPPTMNSTDRIRERKAQRQASGGGTGPLGTTV